MVCRRLTSDVVVFSGEMINHDLSLTQEEE